ncbi:4-hydroxythreonine-4-phosphate dehydrogenase PdxA [Polynucleobacter sp. MG-28-Ekke-A2]|jgi:4-hydroxythreonine-4-phosphate dehydrogenase|uniref:4-hydroxythreonine-4-phosphate dehydrogenase PdxA n=1 Tax=Polynucleobacter sp. MG-28-Ekke-A2 TaxID=3108276 RepID=UPI002B224A46|nr:4-hydroxythreonine-4-phosphate dehydrogenase PdxA [Polynucleobacter sp. MG-28-Ekke-A2]MEA9600685.1 4-hydroxythreonine-4-phosphate dehydrogenase PdxA [Polynucleobacter sp. MG-28-Ekke-A2]
MQQAAHLVNLVITTGEPAGVGPEVSLAASLEFLREHADARITLLGNDQLLTLSKGLSSELSSRLQIQSFPLGAPVVLGSLNSQNAQYVVNLLDQAIDGCQQGRFDAMVTAPLQKSIINEAGTPFTGHTEYLAQRCKVSHVVMMLCAPLPIGFLGLKVPRDLRVALVTTHLPLKEVAPAVSYDLILETIQIVNQDLQQKFGIVKPIIRMAGLNPHAGESGYLGREEIDAISPSIEAAKKMGIHVSGPYPGDTMFDPESVAQVDAFIAMYHDQGLAPFKFVTFGNGVNVTLGLPIIRTSVDHGTALDIAGKGVADSKSMLEALRLAYKLALNKRKQV